MFCNPLGLSKFFVLCKCKEITVQIRKCLYYGKGSILFPGMFGYPFQEPDRRSWMACMSWVLARNLGGRGRSFRSMQSLYSRYWGCLYPDGVSAMLTTNIYLLLVWRVCGAIPVLQLFSCAVVATSLNTRLTYFLCHASTTNTCQLPRLYKRRNAQWEVVSEWNLCSGDMRLLESRLLQVLPQLTLNLHILQIFRTFN